MTTVAITTGRRPKRSPMNPNITPPTAVMKNDEPSANDEAEGVRCRSRPIATSMNE
jgi:hypothetical protein